MSPTSTPKRLPDSDPEGQNDAQKCCWISGSILAPILSFLGSQKASQKAPKIAQNSPSAPQGRPKASREPPGSLQGAILASFWSPGTSFSNLSSALFEACARHHLARAPPPDRKHGSKSLPKGSFATSAGQMRTTPQAQWSVWGRRPTGDPATEPSGSRGGRERSDF